MVAVVPLGYRLGLHQAYRSAGISATGRQALRHIQTETLPSSPPPISPPGRHALAKAGGPAHIGRMLDHPTRDAGFGVYVHWPFCLSKCPYCDFNSHVRDKGIDEARFLAAFRREIAHMAALAPGRTVTSVFFGGGTPSLMRRRRRPRFSMPSRRRGRSRPTPRSRSRRTRRASRRRALPAIGRPASTGSRSACRR